MQSVRSCQSVHKNMLATHKHKLKIRRTDSVDDLNEVINLIRVLFVCLGNICRSPMAEAVFRDYVNKEGLGDKFFIDSAGLGGWHIGEGPHHGTRKILKKYNISGEGLVARKIETADLDKFDYIIAMDDDNLSGIQRLRKDHPKAYVAKLMDFVPDADENNVPDPYYTGNFEQVYHLVTMGCRALLEKIKAEHGL